jgi:uncharacterized metal-binding protein YceD (DUF177 family)
MRLDITDVLREVGKHLDYSLEEPPMVDEDVECTQPITGKIEFTNTGGTLLIRGKAETGIALPCSRCGIYFERITRLKIDESFELKHTSTGPRYLQTVTVIEEDESPIANKLFEGHVFNLSELLRQYILLDQPTQPLPVLDKAGKCVQCHKTPAQVLADAGLTDPEAPINPAFSKLNELIAKNPPE